MGYLHIDNLYKAQEILTFRQCYALEKIHGTSAHVAWKQGRVLFFSGGVAQKSFEELFDSAYLAVRFRERFTDDDTVTIFSAQSQRPHAIASRVGAVVSLAYGSSGAAYLGALPDEEVKRIVNAAPAEAWKHQKRETVLQRVRDGRRLGVYSDSGSYQPNIHTLSAPLYGPNREVAGVITLLGFPQDFAGAAKSAVAKELKYTAGGCSQLIQGAAAET